MFTCERGEGDGAEGNMLLGLVLHTFVHPGGASSSFPARTEAEEKLRPSSWLSGCSSIASISGNAAVLPPAQVFCFVFTAAGIVLRGPPWAASAASKRGWACT